MMDFYTMEVKTINMVMMMEQETFLNLLKMPSKQIEN